MSKKVTISVPDELHEKMEKWRGDFNFSKVFQDAVSDLIQKKEDFKNRMKGEKQEMTEIIESLKQEKKEADEQWYETGKKDGLEFAKSADYKTLQYARTWETINEMPGNTIGWDPTRNDVLGDYFNDIFDTYDEMNFEETSYGNAMPNEAFCKWEVGGKRVSLHFGMKFEISFNITITG
jgi:hypothetical protein